MNLVDTIIYLRTIPINEERYNLFLVKTFPDWFSDANIVGHEHTMQVQTIQDMRSFSGNKVPTCIFVGDAHLGADMNIEYLYRHLTTCTIFPGTKKAFTCIIARDAHSGADSRTWLYHTCTDILHSCTAYPHTKKCLRVSLHGTRTWGLSVQSISATILITCQANSEEPETFAMHRMVFLLRWTREEGKYKATWRRDFNLDGAWPAQ